MLQLDDSVQYSGLVTGFGQPDLFDLRDIPFTAGVTSATWSQSDPTSGSLQALIRCWAEPDRSGLILQRLIWPARRPLTVVRVMMC